MKLTRLWTLFWLCAVFSSAHASNIESNLASEQSEAEVAAIDDGAIKDVPDFKAIKNVAERKQAFIDYLRPSYDIVAAGILSQRSKLEFLKAQLAAGIELSPSQIQLLEEMGEQYRIASMTADIRGIEQLLVRVDILPPELVFSQAATESGWGTSKMARELNNFFGHYCFERGCGVSPYRRKGSGEVKSFESPTLAIQAYMKNVNTHPAYKQVRKLRADMRAEVKPLDAVVLAKGFRRYSSQGDRYVQKIQGMIKTNRQYWSDENQNR